MYRHCPSCTGELGSNEILETFPVGRRLAFDSERGRLWAICPRCRAWNLAPIEERWEAVEQAEREFGTAAVGATTEHISLGRAPDGTELVRIGIAKPPEVAGWRYAARISSRWKRTKWTIAAASGGSLFYMLGGAQLVPFAPALVVAWSIYRAREEQRWSGQTLEATPTDEPTLQITYGDLTNLRLYPGAREEEWRLALPRGRDQPLEIPTELRSRALRLSLLARNRESGRPSHVQNALSRVLEVGDSDVLIAQAASALSRGESWVGREWWRFPQKHVLAAADPVLRLALEIAANEEAERVALEGELHVLETEWRDAEEIAAISDNLLVPEWMRARIRSWREGKPGS